jgi:hypothetical protein
MEQCALQRVKEKAPCAGERPDSLAAGVAGAVADRWRCCGAAGVVEHWFAGGGPAGWNERFERTVALKIRERNPEDAAP